MPRKLKIKAPLPESAVVTRDKRFLVSGVAPPGTEGFTAKLVGVARRVEVPVAAKLVRKPTAGASRWAVRATIAGGVDEAELYNLVVTARKDGTPVVSKTYLLRFADRATSRSVAGTLAVSVDWPTPGADLCNDGVMAWGWVTEDDIPVVSAVMANETNTVPAETLGTDPDGFWFATFPHIPDGDYTLTVDGSSTSQQVANLHVDSSFC